MVQKPPSGKPWAAGKDAAERSKLFCTFVAAGNFLPEITDAEAIAANAAHSDKAVSCCQRQRPAVSGEDEQELRADGAPASLRKQIELLQNSALDDVERHEAELKQVEQRLRAEAKTALETALCQVEQQLRAEAETALETAQRQAKEEAAAAQREVGMFVGLLPLPPPLP